MAPDIEDIRPLQLRQLLDAGEPITLLDVREPFEWEISNLGAQGARLIPMSQLPQRLDELDRDADIVVYCRTGSRSLRVARYLAARGYTRVRNLDGGINAWAEEVDPDLEVY